MIDIIHVVVVLFVVAVLAWLANLAPMQETVRKIFNGAIVVGVVIWLLQMLLPYVHLHF